MTKPKNKPRAKSTLEQVYPNVNAYKTLKRIGNCGYPTAHDVYLNRLAREIASVLAASLND